VHGKPTKGSSADAFEKVDRAGVDLETGGAMMQSSGGDAPDAHEICLMRKVDHEGNVAAVQHPSTGK